MSTSWDSVKKPGGGWAYNEVGYTYNQATDPDSGLSVYYNSVGLTTQWTALIKP